MKTIIYYYSGTGNALWTSRCIATALGRTTVHPMLKMNGDAMVGADAVGLVFPVHMWGVPSLVLAFMQKVKWAPEQYFFAFAVNAGQVSRTLIQLHHRMAAMGLTLSLGIDIVLPSNYIPWGGPGPKPKLERLFQTANDKILHVAPCIAQKQAAPMERGALWQRIVFTAVYQMTWHMIPKMDKHFWVDAKCNGCGICAKVCPVGNIAMVADKPTWSHRCEQCLACIQWCPEQALQYGRKTPHYERYHHPAVKLKDMVLDRTPNKK